jgi:8-oxo-dGTP diphosphatase
MKLATLCYITKDNKTLMLKRDKKKNDIHKGFFVPPGGKFEFNESPEECAIREVFEETNLIVKDPKLKGFLTFESNKDNPFEDLWYVWVYLFNDFEGELKECNEGTLYWIDNNKLLDLEMWEGDKIFTPLVFQDKLFSMKFKYVNDKLKKYDIKYI